MAEGPVAAGVQMREWAESDTWRSSALGSNEWERCLCHSGTVYCGRTLCCMIGARGACVQEVERSGDEPDSLHAREDCCGRGRSEDATVSSMACVGSL